MADHIACIMFQYMPNFTYTHLNTLLTHCMNMFRWKEKPELSTPPSTCLHTNVLFFLPIFIIQGLAHWAENISLFAVIVTTYIIQYNLLYHRIILRYSDWGLTQV